MAKKQFIPALLYAVSLLTLSVSGKVINHCENKHAVDAEMIVQGYEWGPAVPKVIVKFNDIVTGVKKDTFTVKTGDTEREILSVYNSDAFGNRRILPTKYLSFDLKVKTVYVPFINTSFGEASPFVYDMETGINDWAPTFDLELNLAQNKTFNIGYCKQSTWETYTKNLMEDYVIPETAYWEKDTFTPSSGNFTLQRASFTPFGAKRDGVKNPLIIWLHGAGEGGSDVDITLLGNEVTALAKDGIQKYFTTYRQRGAYVLAVQTPTMWMDKGDGTYNSDIDGEKQTSKYDAALFEAIQDYVKNNRDIDTNRIYIGGCSNGGYMTMNLMFEHGDFFTAFYPICEAYMNRNISDEMIDQVKDYNIWLIHSEDDTTVNPLETSIPSYYRLINAGAKNVHYTLFENVRGTDDPDAIYMGHYSWVYAFNDQVKKEFDNEKTLEDFENITIEKGKLTSTDNYVTNANCNKEGNMWSWLAKQTKKN
ncbi:alpha/beta-hydrolase [Neocallimastix lanati (nom. inval.)]|jgi:predicted esterase|uniref:Alpha/beta-hydrolase n=1 Tax=Neocallimastix californiae TaxID=1754190 RepID=A0A1Y2DM43_9FUNG|nr:alpha/beta-hydrolase [Neocallimastix sp. JGI-2020a]ORY60327.1 alpha/beta-hydrolase [Neocallimastix californiae]|eukprot:ORY60327.1 alpha/beta-hydrolase [Neocallimastix californiae]